MNKNLLLVNSITAITWILGMAACALALHGFFYYSFSLVLLAFVADSLDGFLARKLKAESRFGAIFDALGDILIYLLYPSLIFYNKFGVTSRIGILFILIFFAAGIFRLIRFTKNGFIDTNGKKYYSGMPVVMSLSAVLIMIFINAYYTNMLQPASLVLLGAMSFLMVSKFKFGKPSSTSATLLLICTILVISILTFIYGLRTN